MDPRTNQFYEGEQRRPEDLSFVVGEELVIKGHVFAVQHVAMAPFNKLTLKPVRPAEPRTFPVPPDAANPPLA